MTLAIGLLHEFKNVGQTRTHNSGNFRRDLLSRFVTIALNKPTEPHERNCHDRAYCREFRIARDNHDDEAKAPGIFEQMDPDGLPGRIRLP